MKRKPVDRLLADRLSRRDVLMLGGGVAVAAGLSACGMGSGGSSQSGDATRKIVPKVDGDLVYFNYTEYINPVLFKRFEKKYNVKIRESNYDSMPAMMAKLSSGNQYDLVFPSAEYVKPLSEAGKLLEIPREKLPGAKDIFPNFDDPPYDPGSRFSLPYSMYVTGIGYRSDHVGGMTGSWNDLANPEAQGRSYMIDDYQEAIGMANLVNGHPLNDSEHLDEARDYLIDLKSKLRGFNGDPIAAVGSGNAWVTQIWNGDAINARARLDDPEVFRFQKCKEGMPFGSDCFVIPANAQHPGTALLFINFILENSAENVTWSGYSMPTFGSQKAYAELVGNEPELKVTVEDVDRGQRFEYLSTEDRQAWTDAWTEVKAA